MTRVILLALSLLFLCVDAHTQTQKSGVKFATRKVKLGTRQLIVEIADSAEKRAQGLMFRKTLANDRGMLFVFEREEPLGFWMKNTLIPLAIGYFDREKKLLDVHEMTPAVAGEAMPKTYHSARPAMYALEVPKGWYTHNKVLPGATFSFVGGE
jgi:uncharacterized membrane protein (UPF0127 family)